MKKLLGIVCLFALGCGAREALKEVPPTAPGGEEASKSSSDPLPLTYGAEGVGAWIGPMDEGGRFCVRFDVSGGQGSAIHVALFKMPEQELDEASSRVLWYVPQDISRTICVQLPERCFTYQVDGGVGAQIPAHGAYTGANFITSQELGLVCGRNEPDSTPTPTPTPQQVCEDCQQPTPTPRPSASPTPRPTPTQPPPCNGPSGTPLLCHSPYGSPESECAAFGLSPLGKDDGLSGATHIASMSAALAIVKDGRGPCPQGQTAYRLYKDVQAGQTLEKPWNAGAISHVTYCGCGT